MSRCDYETLMSLLADRRSVRRFDDRAVDPADIDKLVEAARWAPSNHNRQGWKFVVFSDADELARIAEQVRHSLAIRLDECAEIPPASVRSISLRR